MHIISRTKLRQFSGKHADKDQVIYIKYILTHAEYDKDEWKNDPYFKP